MKKGRFNRVIPITAVWLLILAVVPLTLSCQPAEKTYGKIGVVVTILPQAEFVESVGGERVEVSVMVPPGASVETYEPTPAQLTALSRAKMYAKLGSGIDFELVWMDKLQAANKKMLVIDSSRGVQPVAASDEKHGANEPHVWSSPLNAIIMVQNIYDGLVQIDPDNQAYYQQNRDAYIQRLRQLDQEIRDKLSGVTNRVFMVYHPDWTYFARDYNFTMLAIEEEGKEPTAATLVRLVELAKQHKIKVVFVSPEFSTQSAKVIAKSMGGRVEVIYPLARDYIANMRRMVAKLVQSLE